MKLFQQGYRQFFILAISLGVLLLFFAFGQQIREKFFRGQLKAKNEEAGQMAKETSEVKLERSFEFLTTNAQGRQAKITYTLISAKKTKMVANQGQPVTAPKGKEILVLDVEIENQEKTPLAVNAQDFIRLVKDNGKRYAPEFYNNPLSLPPISIRQDQVGFLIDEGQTLVKLQLGEIEKEEKETIEINF